MTMNKVYFRDGHTEDLISAMPQNKNCIIFTTISGYYYFSNYTFYKYHEELVYSEMMFSGDAIYYYDRAFVPTDSIEKVVYRDTSIK